MPCTGLLLGMKRVMTRSWIRYLRLLTISLSQGSTLHSSAIDLTCVDKRQESFEQYITVLRQLAQRCAFGTITDDEILRDRILFSIENQQVRERLLREANLTLARTIDICRAAESTAAQTKD